MLQSQIKKITKTILKRETSLFSADLTANEVAINSQLDGACVLIIGGAGTIGQAYLKLLLNYPIRSVSVIDKNENGLAELVRNLRSSGQKISAQIDFQCMDYGSSIFKRFYEKRAPFDFVANFAAHKHVRSEDTLASSLAMLENNVLNQKKLLDLLSEISPKAYFSVSTDKADRPVSIMGASKKLMEMMMLSYKKDIHLSSARFPNVLFSKGSLMEGLIYFYENKKPLPCPLGVKRYFISKKEAAHICLIAHFLSESGDIIFPKLNPLEDQRTFESIVRSFLEVNAFTPKYFQKEDEAMRFKIDSNLYPVLLSPNNTSGEKDTETFFSEIEQPEMNAFQSLARIRPKNVNFDSSRMTIELKTLIEKTESKKELISFLKSYLPDFDHNDQGLSLNSKY